jgi:signal transduction histidine kinase
VIKETIATNSQEKVLRIIVRSRWWIIGCVLLAYITFTEWFVPVQMDAEIPKFGRGYYVYIGGVSVAYALLCRGAINQMRHERGAVRLELQIVLLGGSAAALGVVVLMGLRATLGLAWVTKLQPFLVLGFFAGTAVAITTTRILDARQIILLVVDKVALVAAVATFAFWADHGLSKVLPGPFDYLTTIAVSLWFATIVNSRLDRLFQFYPETNEVRRAIFAVAQRETRVDTLVTGFCKVLKGWGQASGAFILYGAKSAVSGSGIEVPQDSGVFQGMRRLRWATPERLVRERPTEGRREIREFLAKHELGVLVMSEGPALSALVGVGTGASRRPFTYPQVTQLLELAAIIEATLERAHFSAKVQHTEQLATVGLLGASLAHEIRNPLVSIKTFVQLLPTHYQDAKFRDKFFRLISDEVGRIDQLTEQLLDLASPRTYVAKEVELHPVLQASLDLVAAKAADRGIEFRTELTANPDRAFTDASAAKQVMLNLCFNAIQAIDSEPREERWVKIATRNTSGGLEMIVADSGPGIAPEMQARLFQPFQTTKSTGFGLGLAICSDILANLNASIRVDPAEPGRGAIFRVTFPCQPSLS